MSPTRPAFDPELEVALPFIHEDLPATITADVVARRRAQPPADVAAFLGGVRRRDESFTAPDGATIEISILTPLSSPVGHPLIYFIHGGGMVMGNRWEGIEALVPWIEEFGVALATIEYRLAPENPDPIPVEDCFAGLRWVYGNARALGVDPGQVIVMGESAGGGLAAGCALLARDRGMPQLRALLLGFPMLDDRDSTVSAAQFDGVGIWDRTSNAFGWGALLGQRRGTNDVSIYAAPARAEDLSGLPPTYIDCGEAEVFRDEAVNLASRMWAQGESVELHIWQGGYHVFPTCVPAARVSQAAQSARRSWIARILSQEPTP